MPQTLPPSASAYQAAQAGEISAALASVRRTWGLMGSEFDTSWERVRPRILLALDTAQQRIALGAAAYMPRVMAEVGLDVPEPDWDFDPTQMVGVAGDGGPTESLAYGAVVRSKAAVADGASWSTALQCGGAWLTTAASTALSDTGRTVEQAVGNAHGVRRYVRMLEPPSCGRCVILAGRVTRSSEPFARHPRCDCRNIPAAESDGGDARVTPEEYLDGLDDAALAKTLGSKANVRAYKEHGADMYQLVNSARGGVRKAQLADGRRIRYTTEGTTRRGVANRRMRAWSRGPIDARGRKVVTEKRLMPQTIFEMAGDDRERARELLDAYGWLG
jgi:hypothetical protein